MELTKLRAELRDGSLPQVEFELKGRDVILATRLPGEEDPAARDITELAYSWTIRDARSGPNSGRPCGRPACSGIGPRARGT